MTFAAPLGLLALVSVPIIIGIHLFRRRFPERRIAGLFLWQAGREVAQGGGRIDRLPITWSLLLELLAAIALSLILAGARLTSAAEIPHLVVLLDDSASMSAVGADGTPVRARAVERVLRELEVPGRRGRVTLVRSGDRPVVLAGPAALPAEAEAALERWAPRAPHHALAPGLRLARELAGTSGRLLIVSDTTAERRNEGDVANALWVSLGEPRPNVGIIGAARTPAAGGQGTIVLTLGNYSDATQSRRLTLVAAGKTMSVSDVAAPPGVSVVRLHVPAGTPAVLATLSEDALGRDNELLLVEPHARLVLVENRLPDGRARDAAARALASLSNVAETSSGHLQLIEAGTLASLPSSPAWRAAFGAPPPSLRGRGDADDFIGPYVIEKRHPLLLGVRLGGVVWTGAHPLAAGIRPLASAGDRGLIADVTPPGAPTTLLFNLDLERTNLIRTPDWPILVSNLVELRRQQLPGPERWNYRIGEWVRVRFGRDPKAPLRVRSGDGAARDLPASRQIEVLAPDAAGRLEILEGDATLFTLGVNFLDDNESDLRTRTSGESGAYPPELAGSRSERNVASDPVFWTLLSIAGAALVANWCLPRVERPIA